MMPNNLCIYSFFAFFAMIYHPEYAEYAIPILHNTIYGNDIHLYAVLLYTLCTVYLHKVYGCCSDAVALLNNSDSTKTD